MYLLECPRGLMLGPLLFLTYVNDRRSSGDVQLEMFADDCLIYARMSNKSYQLKLNSALQEIEKWSNL